VRPLFLLSLPRTGSTLVQRVLGAHEEVATVSEPWLLLPQFYAARTAAAVRAEYSHEMGAEALRDFWATLPGGRDEYLAAVRELALTLYRSAGGEGRRYFLDKTPRYHAVARDVIDLFDDAKIVFLWRHPLAVMSSLLDTYRLGRFEPYNFAFDLFDGVENLTAAARHAGVRAHQVRYEDLVAGGDSEWRKLFEYLELEFDPGLLTSFPSTQLHGRYGDQRHSQGIDGGSLEGWRAHASSRVGNAWCRRYVRWIGQERLAAMGYDQDAILYELAQVPVTSSGLADAGSLTVSRAAHMRRRRALRVPESPRPIGPNFTDGATGIRRLAQLADRHIRHRDP
jgi:hypothetical protein